MIFTSLFAATLWATSLAAPTQSGSNVGSLVQRDADLDSLLLIIKAQDDVNDPDDLTVSSCLINNGKNTLKILNDPNGPLTTWKTHTFEFYEVASSGTGLKARSGGNAAHVSAVRVKYNPEVVAALADPSTYTVLQPGENKTVTHDLSGMYSFQTSGSYAVKTTTNAENFRIIKEDGSIGIIQAKLYDGAEAANWTAVNVAESGTYASLRGLASAGIPTHLTRRWEEENSLTKRQTFRNCSASQQKYIAEGVVGANAYIAEVNKYLATTYYLGNKRYRTWFGPYEKKRWNQVKSHYLALRNQPARFRYDCSCQEVDTFAYVYPDQFGTIYLCGAFWKAPVKGTDSKAGTIIHEATHFTKLIGTDDYAYGHTDAMALAKSNPAQAIMNADSHEYFAENTPFIA
ncbi:peptidyl-Lys metalloendopeptidase [Ceratobasidium sp. AG-Ba]|nr:peptidyl-Lys metalloendopeptidase [Ceratobasidium sp. AG-Ba]